MKLLNIDGADATGKSTLVNNLINHYTKQGKKITFLHFPRYDTEIGKVIKKVMFKETEMHPSALQMLYSSDRLNWYTYEFPKLQQEFDIVIVDRYLTSGMVYGAVDGLDPQEILFNDRRTAKPDANIILIADAETSLKRMAVRNETATLYENAENIKSATEKYLNLINLIPNVFYIDAKKSIEDNLKDAISIIDGLGDKNE
jgi:dTMP kinase